MYYGGFLWKETLHLPVTYKRWFIERIVKELNKTDAEGNSAGQSRALHQNSPETREMQGRFRSQSPSRMRRLS